MHGKCNRCGATIDPYDWNFHECNAEFELTEALKLIRQLKEKNETQINNAESEIEYLEQIILDAYCSAYESGHHDTVEGVFMGTGRASDHIESAREWREELERERRGGLNNG